MINNKLYEANAKELKLAKAEKEYKQKKRMADIEHFRKMIGVNKNEHGKRPNDNI